MSPPNDLPFDAWMDARVEAYIDDDLSPPERARFEARVREDANWQEQLERARAIQRTLQSKRVSLAPTQLVGAILRDASLRVL